MAVNTGTRPGTKQTQRIPGWDYVQAEKGGWADIRKDDREVQRFDSAVNDACNRFEKALLASSIASVMLHGGHVDKGLLAKSGVRTDWTPGQVLAYIQELVPEDLALRAIKP